MRVKELFPDCEDTSWGRWYCSANYDDLVGDFGTILAEGRVGDYQGDFLYLLRNGDRFGYVCVGYGSCSGCDALEACESYENLQRLYEFIRDSVDWWDSREEALAYFTDKDWSTDYTYHYKEEQQQFVSAAIKALETA
jgi:hypothetical protein